MKGGILQDWEANAGNWKSRSALLLYRAAQAVRRKPALLRVLGSPVVVLYVIYVEWTLGIELNLKSKIGRVSDFTMERAWWFMSCGARKQLCPSPLTTIGMKNGPADCPRIGNDVDIGSTRSCWVRSRSATTPSLVRVRWSSTMSRPAMWSPGIPRSIEAGVKFLFLRSRAPGVGPLVPTRLGRSGTSGRASFI